MLDESNASIIIYRKSGNSQRWHLVPGFTEPRRALVGKSKEGIYVSQPWFPGGIDETKGRIFATHTISLGGTDENPPGYKPTPGDFLVITNTSMLNGTYKQVADNRTIEGYGLDGYGIPCIRISTSTTPISEGELEIDDD